MPSRRFCRAATLAAAAAISACRPADPARIGTTLPDSVAIKRDIAFLADDRLEGRATGSAGNNTAAAYLMRRYKALGLAASAQPFTAHPPARNGTPPALPTQNIYAILPGTDASLRDEYVVVGAHFDHLGRGTQGALDPEAGSAIRNGADDNASGTAAVLALARRFAQHRARRSMLFVNFTGEELGLLGSEWFVNHPPVPLDHVQAMLNFDMVGRLRNDKLIVYGVATATELPAALDSANAGLGFRLSPVGDGFGPSDQSSFYAKNVPVLHFFTDVHPDYHRATDDADRIDVGGEARVIEFAERVARSLADRRARLTFTRAPATAGALTSTRDGVRAYFGSVPEMGASDVVGMQLSGVSPGSPADKAGLKAGDVVVEFGGKQVKDIYGYTDAMGAFKPGDVVAVVFLRGGQRMTVSVTLGKRGG